MGTNLDGALLQSLVTVSALNEASFAVSKLDLKGIKKAYLKMNQAEQLNFCRRILGLSGADLDQAIERKQVLEISVAQSNRVSNSNRRRQSKTPRVIQSRPCLASSATKCLRTVSRPSRSAAPAKPGRIVRRSVRKVLLLLANLGSSNCGALMMCCPQVIGKTTSRDARSSSRASRSRSARRCRSRIIC